MDFYDVNSMSSTLQEVAVRVIGNQKCKTYPDYADKLSDNMLCAGYKVYFLQFYRSRSCLTKNYSFVKKITLDPLKLVLARHSKFQNRAILLVENFRNFFFENFVLNT